MGTSQSNFIKEFRDAFAERFGSASEWSGGQARANTAAFTVRYPCRRGSARASESFELGDAFTSYRGWKLTVEFESKELPLSNLIKYWPYLRGELTRTPDQPLLICHFSDWWSYATRRELWEWTFAKMQDDPNRLVRVEGKQFDHGGADAGLRRESILAAINWIESVADTEMPN
jgi:hypothetical protein